MTQEDVGRLIAKFQARGSAHRKDDIDLISQVGEHCDDPRAAEFLLTVAQDQQAREATRAAAMETLSVEGMCKPKDRHRRIGQALLKIFQQDRSVLIRQHAAEALSAFVGVPGVLAQLEKTVRDTNDDIDVRHNALGAIEDNARLSKCRAALERLRDVPELGAMIAEPASGRTAAELLQQYSQLDLNAEDDKSRIIEDLLSVDDPQVLPFLLGRVEDTREPGWPRRSAAYSVAGKDEWKRGQDALSIARVFVAVLGNRRQPLDLRLLIAELLAFWGHVSGVIEALRDVALNSKEPQELREMAVLAVVKIVYRLDRRSLKSDVAERCREALVQASELPAFAKYEHLYNALDTLSEAGGTRGGRRSSAPKRRKPRK